MSGHRTLLAGWVAVGVCRRFSSIPKNRVTVQFESHQVELAAIYELEHDRDVIEYYDQPPDIEAGLPWSNGPSSGCPPHGRFLRDPPK